MLITDKKTFALVPSESVKQPVTKKFKYCFKEQGCFHRTWESLKSDNNNSTDTLAVKNDLAWIQLNKPQLIA